MSNNNQDRRGSGFFDDVVLSKQRQSNDVKCPNCGHFFLVTRRTKQSEAQKQATEQAEGKPLSVRVLFVLAGLIIVVLSCSLWAVLSRDTEEPFATRVNLAKPPQTTGTNQEPLLLQEAPDVSMALNTASVIDFLREYFKTRTWSERLPFVRQVPGIEGRMQRWYRTHKDEPLRNVAADPKAMEIGGFIVVKLGGDGAPSDHIVIEKTPAGYRVDWESFVVYQDQDWDEIQGEQPRGARMVRCKLEAVQNNHKIWTSEKGYRCYKLVHPKTGQVFWGYCDMRDVSDDDPEMLALRKTPKGRYTLEIYYPENASSGLDVMISRVVAKGWVIK